MIAEQDCSRRVLPTLRTESEGPYSTTRRGPGGIILPDLVYKAKSLRKNKGKKQKGRKKKKRRVREEPGDMVTLSINNLQELEMELDELCPDKVITDERKGEEEDEEEEEEEEEEEGEREAIFIIKHRPQPIKRVIYDIKATVYFRLQIWWYTLTIITTKHAINNKHKK